MCAKFQAAHTVYDLPRAAIPRKLTPEMITSINQYLTKDDELTARKLRNKLREEYTDIPEVSITTIKRCGDLVHICTVCILLLSYRYRKRLGWTNTRPHYCQLIREANKMKRKEWCERQIQSKEQFGDVMFTDECTVQLDHHGRLCFR